MKHTSGKKSLKRRFRRFLYRRLTALNQIDFSKYRPWYVLFTIAVISLMLARLPIPEGYFHSSATLIRTLSATPSEVMTQSSKVSLALSMILSSSYLRAGSIFVVLSLLSALLWFIFSRLHRIRIWFRIYRIRRRKRSTHTLFLKKRFRKFRGI